MGGKVAPFAPCVPGVLGVGGRSITISRRDVPASVVFLGASRTSVTVAGTPPPPQATSRRVGRARTPIAASLRITAPLPDPTATCHPGPVSSKRPAT